MMKTFILPLAFVLIAFGANAQTKRIAHRSHSGSNASFTLHGSDNFGNPVHTSPSYTFPAVTVVDSAKPAPKKKPIPAKKADSSAAVKTTPVKKTPVPKKKTGK